MSPTKVIIARYFAGISLLVAGFYFLFCFVTNSLLEFLRVNEPVHDAEVLIVEGWLSGEFSEFVKDEFQKGAYKYILISGYSQQIDSNHDGEIAEDDTSHDALLASMLLTKEIDSSKIKTINVPDSITIHRTFAMARAAEKWLYNNDPSVRRVDDARLGVMAGKPGLHIEEFSEIHSTSASSLFRRKPCRCKSGGLHEADSGDRCGPLPIIRMLYCGLFF